MTKRPAQLPPVNRGDSTHLIAIENEAIKYASARMRGIKTPVQSWEATKIVVPRRHLRRVRRLLLGWEVVKKITENFKALPTQEKKDRLAYIRLRWPYHYYAVKSGAHSLQDLRMMIINVPDGFILLNQGLRGSVGRSFLRKIARLRDVRCEEILVDIRRTISPSEIAITLDTQTVHAVHTVVSALEPGHPARQFLDRVPYF